MNSLNNNTLLLRDGASKQQDNLDILNATHIAVEDRNIEEFIAEAQRISKELRFFNDENSAVATWESFLIEDSEAYFRASETGKALLRKQWAKKLALFVEQPDSFLKETKTLEKLSQPHTVLFLTFLKLLNHIKSQINGLTQKHLDFYFNERLQLTPKEAIPDVVHVLVELAENVEALELKKGTVFLAGEDANGNDLQYAATEDTVVNQAAIASLKSVFVDKQQIGIQEAHLSAVEEPDKGLSKMFKMALGTPNPGDSLPDFPNEIENLTTLLEAIENKEVAAETYVTEQLFLELEDFKHIVQKHVEEQQHFLVNWEKSYQLLEEAYIKNQREARKEILKAIHEEQGFEALTKHIYGFPNPEDKLPLYEGKITSFTAVYEDLTQADTAVRQKAKDYLVDELKLNEQDFAFLVQTSLNENAPEEDIERFYQLLEQSERQYRSVIIESPVVTKTNTIYAAKDITELAFSQYNKSEESKRFKTFGNVSNEQFTMETANLGFAISSPLLLLKEGTRNIALDLQLKESSAKADEILMLLDQGFFKILFSSEEGWFQPKNESQFSLGYKIKENPDSFLINDFKVTKEDPLTVNFYEPGVVSFHQEKNVGNYIVNIRGEVYRILAMDPGSLDIQVEFLDQIEDAPKNAFMFSEDDLELIVKLSVTLSEEEPSVVVNPVSDTFISEAMPAIAFVVDQEVVANYNKENDVDIFKALMSVAFANINLGVAVTGIKNLVIQNEDSTLNIKKPFEPFGNAPEIGSNFYFTNEEISQKPIQDLQLYTEWSNLPEDFAAHYENYWKVATDSLSPSEAEQLITNNSDFKVSLFVQDQLSELPVKEDVSLFTENSQIAIQNIPALIQEHRPNYVYQQIMNNDVEQTDIHDWQRYFRLELDPIDFQHQSYSQLLAQQGFKDEEIRSLLLNPPYQPKLKKFSVGYTASTTVFTENEETSTNNKVFHIHPFGFNQVRKEHTLNLLPSYEDNGSLYIGLSKVVPSQVVTILFQMAEGSANPDIEKPILHWSYLKDNEWISFDTDTIISDTTSGLLHTGIIRLQIPEDSTLGGTLLPNDLHWLKVSAANNIDGISDIVAIKSQVIQAVLSSEEVAAAHFEIPLQAESITETQEFIPEIANISQPFTSSQGKPKEAGISFKKRISERLRHKNRALSMWDYEHMILENFPEVYKVKCLPSQNELGVVNITVVPEIRQRLPFDPFRPKVAANVLEKIHQFITKHAPAYATIKVSNPTYLKVSVRCTIKFNQGLDEVFYTKKLNEEIKQFLSPWAYGDPTKIRLGGTLDAGLIINFIAERSYVDFVANLKLFQSTEAQPFLDARTINGGQNIVIPDQPDMVIVSDETHVIEVVDETNYDEDSERGINYMMIERDFIVAKDFLTTEE